MPGGDGSVHASYVLAGVGRPMRVASLAGRNLLLGDPGGRLPLSCDEPSQNTEADNEQQADCEPRAVSVIHRHHFSSLAAVASRRHQMSR